jgi:NAD(P)-dependent dehydrogenase (short-subunit alcohol dehydrogenase family)
MEPADHPPHLAIVTGSARRLGREIATALARQGYSIGLHYFQSKADAEETAQAIESLGVRAFLLPADLRDEAQVEGMFSEVARTGFCLKVLVNSAGMMPHADLLDMEVEEWDQTLAINLRAPWLCSRRAAVLMQPCGGSIINITDSGANRAWTGYPAYVISKAALESLTRLLARRFAPQVRVNAIAPGLILPGPDFPEENWQRLVNRLPLPRSGTVEDISEAVIFLVNHTYITGQILTVDGGYQLV